MLFQMVTSMKLFRAEITAEEFIKRMSFHMKKQVHMSGESFRTHPTIERALSKEHVFVTVVDRHVT